VLRIFGQKGEEQQGMRKQHNEKLLNLYSSQNIIFMVKSTEMGGECRRQRTDEKYIQNFSWKPRRKEPLGSSRCRWENDIKGKAIPVIGRGGP
jgi:hypothetical protein